MPSTWFVYLDIVYLLSTYWTYFASYSWVFHCVIYYMCMPITIKTFCYKGIEMGPSICTCT